MVDDSFGVPALTDQGDPFLTNSSVHMVGDSFGVHVEELVRMLDTPHPLQSVVVNESEQVTVALSSRVVSALLTDDIATSGR